VIETERRTLQPRQDADIAPFMATTNMPPVVRWLCGPQNETHDAEGAPKTRAEKGRSVSSFG
jgi:hypothetical protein